MDSPLNRAHQQERKAEQLILSKKYMEAVTCYEIASGYITEAMNATTASKALISMELQYQDHLRKQRILKDKIKRLWKPVNNSEHCGKETINPTLQDNKDREDLEQKSSEVLVPEKSDLSLTSSFSSSQGVLVQAEDVLSSGHTDTDGQNRNSCVQDLQMQVLSLTQALEDSNRENNHLRNIVVKFKEVLHRKLGFSQEQIEELLISEEEVNENLRKSSSENIQSSLQEKPKQNVDEMSENETLPHKHTLLAHNKSDLC